MKTEFDFAELIDIVSSAERELVRRERIVRMMSEGNTPSHTQTHKTLMDSYARQLTICNKLDYIMRRGHLEGHTWG